jgi:hypothetical protein
MRIDILESEEENTAMGNRDVTGWIVSRKERGEPFLRPTPGQR